MPLLVVSPPRINGPIVRLRPGTWKFITQGLKDSEVHIYVHKLDTCLQLTQQLETSEGRDVQAVFQSKGTEKEISIYAELVR